MSEPVKILEVRKLIKTFLVGDKPLEVLKGVELEVCQGEMVGIFGPSGSGKSTLLHLLAYLDQPTDGEVLFRGRDLSGLSDREISSFRALHLGFVFQFHHLLPEFSSLENVMIPMLITGVSMEEARIRARKLLSMVGLGDRERQKPETLSGGERQRVAVARALSNSPSLLLADEPTGNLDKENTLALMELFVKLNRERGATMVLVSHDERLVQYFEKVYYLEYGVLRRVEKT